MYINVRPAAEHSRVFGLAANPVHAHVDMTRRPAKNSQRSGKPRRRILRSSGVLIARESQRPYTLEGVTRRVILPALIELVADASSYS